MNDPATHRDLQALRDLVDAYRRSDKEAFAIVQAAAEKAVDKANEANERRLNILNEYREMAQDRDANFVTRDFWDSEHRSLNEKVEGISGRMATMEGRITAIGVVGTLFGIGGVLYALLK